jgi:predicted nucleotidyltransferase component of viral defense system
MNEQALKDRLQIISKEKTISFNECWKQLLLERFLARLSRSNHHQSFIFKGGFLLSYMLTIGRETTDLDFLLTNMQASQEDIKNALEEIIAVNSEDGFIFICEDIELLEQPHMDYPGYRVSLKANFGCMRDKIQVDIGVGDVVIPTTRELHLFQYKGKSLFEDEISLLVYPPETIFAEKLETLLSKGAANSRMKDYHDLILMTREPHMLDFDKLQSSIETTFNNRGTKLEFIDFSKNEVKLMEKLWIAHLNNLKRLAQQLKLPASIQEVIMEINRFLWSQ